MSGKGIQAASTKAFLKRKYIRYLLGDVGGSFVLLLIGIALGVFVIAPRMLEHPLGNSTLSPPDGGNNGGGPSDGNGQTNPLQQYIPAIKKQIAQGLNLTSDQLTTQLQAGKSLNDIAPAQGISSTKVQTIIDDAIQKGLQPGIDNGTITQDQVNQLKNAMHSNPQLQSQFLNS